MITTTLLQLGAFIVVYRIMSIASYMIDSSLHFTGYLQLSKANVYITRQNYQDFIWQSISFRTTPKMYTTSDRDI